MAGALNGIKIIDLSRVLAGPFSTMILGDLGAEVIKVEGPKGDETRTWGPPFKNDVSAYFFGSTGYFLFSKNRIILQAGPSSGKT